MLDRELIQILEGVFQTVLGSTPRAATSVGVPSHPLTASISFEGAFRGELKLTCSRSLATAVAASMFKRASDDTGAEDLRDALAELVNIVGGNLKAVLPSPCRLSLPAVGEGHLSAEDGREPLTLIYFEHAGEPFVLRLTEERPARHPTEDRLRGR